MSTWAQRGALWLTGLGGRPTGLPCGVGAGRPGSVRGVSVVKSRRPFQFPKNACGDAYTLTCNRLSRAGLACLTPIRRVLRHRAHHDTELFQTPTGHAQLKGRLPEPPPHVSQPFPEINRAMGALCRQHILMPVGQLSQPHGADGLVQLRMPVPHPVDVGNQRPFRHWAEPLFRPLSFRPGHCHRSLSRYRELDTHVCKSNPCSPRTELPRR